ncbi:acyl-CoA dehydrogenase family protein [Actinoplanes sp. NEAU-A12]|uniref:Acyl-CoA dehydrogenase family protein n=1 Tax=Actinoplanes sandaracinus TaxID=3045177 RepID=A0ABT6WCE0_9ACTN|nr:acyl-CoA dehydrogenase family protein [Actinoplanes sandaracinus]MDI6097405.1 acyl-CoA dehydrogenase family protein [Actinoplanes sandaracinus]
MREERAALRAAVRGLLGGRVARAADHGEIDAGWARLCKEIGVAGLAVPEAYGGAGATLIEANVVLTELGRVLSPMPMLGSVLATQALVRSGDDDACARLLPGICAGEPIAAVAWEGSGEVRDGLISGSFRDVLDAGAAHTLLVAAGGALYEVDAGRTDRQLTGTLDLTRRLETVRLDHVPGRRLAGDDPLPGLRDVACVALAAEQVGTAERALELTVEYVKARHQFGRPIGSFQVLQHRLAEAYVRVEAARSAAEAAANAVAAGSAEAQRLAAVAKVSCSETVRAVAAEMVQMHGGIAITWEHDAHLYLRRAWASAQLFGSPAGHVARLTPTLLD